MKKSPLILVLLLMTLVVIFLSINLIMADLTVDQDEDGHQINSDCNDTNPSVFQNVLAYIDNDLDGIGSGGLITLCIGDILPSGYVNSTSPHNDCNDSNPDVWRYVIVYNDIDRDLFGALNQTQICLGNTIPDQLATNNLDCNDNDPTINPNATDIPNDGIDQNCDSFDNVDYDLDGFFRYSINSSLKDCNDLEASIHPFAIEKCNNIDDDCDGKVDEDFTNKGTTCFAGVGECMVEGKLICNAAGNDTFCRAVPKKPGIEICDSKDNDCDGQIDEGNVCDMNSEQLIVLSPNNPIYNSKNILINLTTGLKSDMISYIDNSLIKPREFKLCTDCNKYSKNIQFSEGYHNITFSAIFSDVMFKVSREFIIDSKKPQVSSPKIITKGFTNGSNLTISYSENNLKEVLLSYTINKVTNNISKLDCPSGKNQVCSIDVDLSPYNGKEIVYNFKVIDIADNFIISKDVTAMIDTRAPVINNPESLFIVDANRVYFKVNVTDDNFKDVTYFDPQEKYPKWRVLCSKLSAGICEKMQIFPPGEHTLSLRVTDKAGNFQQVEI